MNGSAHDYTRLSAAEQAALEEVLAAYALGALGEAETAAVGVHVAACPACRSRAAGFTTTVGLLPEAYDDVEPAPELRSRLLVAVRTARADTATVEPAPLPTDRRPDRTAAPAAPTESPATGRTTGARPPRARPGWRWALPTAALLLLSIGLGAWSMQLQRELERQREIVGIYQNARQLWRLDGAGPAAQATGMLVEPATGPPLLLAHDLPALPASQAYQAWVIRDGRPISARVFPPGAGGELLGELSQDVAGASTVAITVEPAGGSPGPTGPIVLAANL
jgi:anti-sigma-K factor RskA